MSTPEHGKVALQLIREARGKTREECAAALGINPKTWKRWELGHNQPQIGHLFAAARYLGVPVGELNDWPIKKTPAASETARVA